MSLVEQDITEIMKSLPHRYPFLLVDRVLECDVEQQSIVAIKNVTINEPFFQGHFPGMPIMPGVLQLEAMAQVGGLLMNQVAGTDGQIPFFMGIDKAKFRKPVTPGDQLRIEVKILKLRSRSVKMEGKIFVDGKVASQAELMCMMTDQKAEV
ncbi:MAG: 3-hydroxyacyl-ACP dehydratase FabZ [Kiritimatiellae bacterium]|nr:3-hydroxyacyl-ACP dehydratase FabZ [Kiritimatiellia bacterium]